MKKSRVASVNTTNCVSCGTCVSVCPKRAIVIANGCFASVDVQGCVGCGMCARNCPTGCIEVTSRELLA